MRAVDAFLSLAAVAFGAGLAKTDAGSPVTHIPADKVNAAFAKGAVLVNTGNYTVYASRRDTEGQAEVHVRDDDIIYVLEGSATFVTGGEVVGARTTAPDEIRGASTRGGRTQTIARGDVIVVPKGIPHWFREIPGPLLYYVVKVR